ncbi:MAG: Uma2 family endonuclease [Planctomycetes bacterium]|nr:Uma2 family endonuclease [Planctomycetota bacterium]
MKTAAHVSAERFERIAHELGPCELVKGEIVPMSPGGFEPSRVVMQIAGMLWTWANRAGTGRVVTGEAGILVDRNPDTVRGADVLYISFKRLPKGREWAGFLRQPPEVVVEVLGQKDTWDELEAKVAEYHKFGVDIVWVAEPKTRSVRIYSRGVEPAVVQGDDEISGVKLLPGFRCKVREFFAE